MRDRNRNRNRDPDRTPWRAAISRGPFRWWAGRSGADQLELVTHWCFYAYALGLGVAAAPYVTDGLGTARADTGAGLLLLAYGLAGGRAASQALHWAMERRARPTVLMAAVTAMAVPVLLLVLHVQSRDSDGEKATAAVFAVGSVMLPVAVLTVRSLPLLRIAGLVAAAVAVVTAGTLAAGMPGVVAFVNAWSAWWAGCAAVFASRVSGWSVQIIRELHDARETRARLAVAEERLRFARDLHDVMGGNLSVVALQSELAAQLVRRGATDAAVGQMEEVQRIAREAQAEVRAVVRGYREADLATELSGARGVLEAAGIDCVIDAPGPDGDGGPDGVVSLLPSVQAALGWVVREATTNVLRHANAASCEIRLRAEAGHAVLTVANNGVRAPGPNGDGTGDGGAGGTAGGTGLTGLRERLAALGGTLTTRAQDGTFVLTASVPRKERR
jgi:two-component system, NarL family, sensor histidine kinase DesK